MYKYIAYIPQEYYKHEILFPLLIFLHGTPQRGDDFTKLKNVALPKLLEQELITLPMIVTAPLCPQNESWDSDLLFSLLKNLKNKYRVDPRRIYLTGFSMGGFGSLKFAKDYPELIAAMAPVCSGGSKFIASFIKDIPTWFFHGKKDKIIDFEKTKVLVDELKTYGSDVKFTEYEDLGHDIWERTYKNIKLYDWFLKYSK